MHLIPRDPFGPRMMPIVSSRYFPLLRFFRNKRDLYHLTPEDL